MSGYVEWLDDQRVVLERLKVGAQQRVSNEFPTMMSSAQWSAEQDRIRDQMVIRLTAHVLAEQLPPQTTDHHISFTTNHQRFATWWDMFKSTYAERWWMRWRHWDVRFVAVPVPVERTVTVRVRDHWTYPTARIALPPKDFGAPVMVSIVDTSDWPAGSPDVAP